MARSLSSFNLLGSSVFDGLCVSISRRGYSAAPPGTVTANFGRPGMVRDAMKESSGVASVSEKRVVSAWGPDPVTGYYRPENCGDQIDAAELREMLLKHRVRPQ